MLLVSESNCKRSNVPNKDNHARFSVVLGFYFTLLSPTLCTPPELCSWVILRGFVGRVGGVISGYLWMIWVLLEKEVYHCCCVCRKMKNKKNENRK